MKNNLLHYMQICEVGRVEGNYFRFRRQANGERRGVSIDKYVYPDEVPEQFRHASVSIDKDAVPDALDAGEGLEWAALKERGEHIRIY